MQTESPERSLVAEAERISDPAWLLALAGHALLVVLGYAVCYAFGLLDHVPGEKLLISWDAGWYQSIRDAGYVPNFSGGQSNIAFFPLFPYLWRLLRLGPLGISLVNGGLLLLGAVWLCRTLGLRRHQLLLLLSVPPLFFCLVPYSEGLFFLFGAVLLRGLHRRQLALTLLGLLGCCLTRSAATLFIPALVLSEVLACTSRADLPRLAIRLGAGLLAIGAALGVVMYLHYQATHDPWAFLEAQKQWSHKMHWPLPARLHSSAGVPVLGLDLLALLTGWLAVLAGLAFGIRWVWGWWQVVPPVPPSRALVFSLVYCGSIIAAILLYQDGDLANSSRYVLATPFFGVLLAQLPRWQLLPQARRGMLAAGAGILALLVMLWCGAPMRFPGFYPGETLFFFACWLGYVGLYVAAFSAGRYSREVRTGLYLANVMYQVMLLDLFLGNTWIG